MFFDVNGKAAVRQRKKMAAGEPRRMAKLPPPPTHLEIYNEEIAKGHKASSKSKQANKQTNKQSTAVGPLTSKEHLAVSKLEMQTHKG